MKLSMAPIQGITDFRFRNVFSQNFSGVDVFYAPYIRLDKTGMVPTARLKDVDPANNVGNSLVPQVMSKHIEEMIFLSSFLFDQGYKEMNWNLGCPYPMVTSQKLGSGLIPYPNMVDDILNKTLKNLPLDLSIKLRMGLKSNDEIEALLPILNKYPIKEIILHPRIGKDLYKNLADPSGFELIRTKTDHSLCYNGDINSIEDYKNLIRRFPELKHLMLGRGLIANPFLAEDISSSVLNEKSKIERFAKFHDLLVAEYSSILSGPSHLITRMRSYWEYFSLSFSNSHKVFKWIKKSTSIDKYDAAVRKILNEEEWLA